MPLWMAGSTIAAIAGEHAAAMAAIDHALAVNPNSAYAWAARGWLLSWQNEADLAIDALHQAMRLSPLDPLAYFFAAGLSMAHIAAGRYEDAIAGTPNRVATTGRLSNRPLLSSALR